MTGMESVAAVGQETVGVLGDCSRDWAREKERLRLIHATW
jgi:hypothetical protein